MELDSTTVMGGMYHVPTATFAVWRG
jgi:hypothetical protein